MDDGCLARPLVPDAFADGDEVVATTVYPADRDARAWLPLVVGPAGVTVGDADFAEFAAVENGALAEIDAGPQVPLGPFKVRKDLFTKEDADDRATLAGLDCVPRTSQGGDDGVGQW